MLNDGYMWQRWDFCLCREQKGPHSVGKQRYVAKLMRVARGASNCCNTSQQKKVTPPLPSSPPVRLQKSSRDAGIPRWPHVRGANVGGLPKDMQLKLIEPLKWLFKDEVRAMGKLLGVPASFMSRHPFPGPGLAVRIMGDVTRLADEIFINSIREAGLYDEICQAFAVYLPVKTVGVKGINGPIHMLLLFVQKPVKMG